MIRMAIAKIATDCGHEIVAEAENGVKAVELVKEKRPDMVTLDITMPEMDGLKCMAELLKFDPNLKILVITAVTNKDSLIEAMHLGAKKYLNKPFSAPTLKEALEAVEGGK